MLSQNDNPLLSDAKEFAAVVDRADFAASPIREMEVDGFSSKANLVAGDESIESFQIYEDGNSDLMLRDYSAGKSFYSSRSVQTQLLYSMAVFFVLSIFALSIMKLGGYAETLFHEMVKAVISVQEVSMISDEGSTLPPSPEE